MYKMSFIVLGLVLLLSFGCLGDEVTVETPGPKAPAEEIPPAPTVVVGGECGEDMDCFLAASENCTPANMTYSVEFSLFGVITTAEVDMEIRGMENGSCVFYNINTAQHASLSPQLKESLLSSGMSAEEIEETEKEAEANAALGVGTETLCRTTPQTLHAVLKSWKDEVSDVDFAQGECVTTYPAALEAKLTGNNQSAAAVEETGGNQSAEELGCVPIATEGYAEVGLYTEDATYFNEAEGKLVEYGKLEIGQSLSLPDGAVVTLEGILINGTCEECDVPPSWTYSQFALLLIDVPEGEDELRIVGVDEHGSFVSSYKCKTLAFSGTACIEYVPDTTHQYYVGRIDSEKLCVESN